MRVNGKSLLFVAVTTFLVFSACMYTVDQRFVAVEKFLGNIRLEQNGKPLIQQPGLHMKFPLLTNVLYFDTRLQTMQSGDAQRIPTKQQKFVYVDYFVKWRIKDFYQFYLATRGDYNRVNELLKPKVSDALKAEFGKKEIEEVVTEDRANIMAKVRDVLKTKAESSLGLEIIDMRIKRIDLPVEVRESVYDRMRTKRQQVANSHRYTGQKRSEEIKAEADYNAKKIIAEASKTAEVTRGQADAKAAKIYANSFSQDPEFYQFYRSLTAYSSVFNNGENMLVLSPDSDFFNYFNKQKNKS